MCFVRAFYLVPRDKEINPEVPIVIGEALKDLQNWYRQELGTGQTFRVFEPIVETLAINHHSNCFSTHHFEVDEKHLFFLMSLKKPLN